MKWVRKVLILAGLGTVLGLTGCGGGGSAGGGQNNPPTVSVSWTTAPPSTLSIGTSTTIGATANNTSSSQVTWTVTCGSQGACGTFGQTSPTIPTVVFSAPTAVPSGKIVTVTATSAADPTKSISSTITITASIAFYGIPPASLQVGRSALVAGLVGPLLNSDANAQVNWTVSCSGQDCGSFAPAQTLNEIGTTYTAPSTIPPGNTVTVTATSAADTTQSVSTPVAITPQVPSLPNGTYVFQNAITEDATEFFNYVSGVFVAQDGAILGGEQDSNSISSTVGVGGTTSTTNPQFQQIVGGSYGTAPDGNLQINLTLASSNNFPPGTETLNGVPGSGSSGFIAQLSGVGGSGTLELQTSTAMPSGGYAFSLDGGDKNIQWAGWSGVLNVDSPGGISGSGSIFDFTDYDGGSGQAFTAQSFAASTVSGPDRYGRVVFKLFPAQSQLGSIYLSGYIVDSSRIRLLEVSGDSFAGDVIGLALGQGASAGSFSSSSVAGSSYVFGMAGLDQNGPVQAAGVLSLNSGGTVAGTMTWEDPMSSVAEPVWPVTGTWAIDPTGRLTLTNINNGTTGLPASFNCDLELDLTGDGNGTLMSTNTKAVNIAGQAFERQAATLTTAQFNGAYGFSGVQEYSNNPGGGGGLFSDEVYGQLNSVASGGTDSLTGFADSNTSSDFGVSGSFIDQSSGVLTGSITGLNPTNSSTEDPFALYVIDSNRAVAIETDRNLTTLLYLAHP
jgi:hypothetical protein